MKLALALLLALPLCAGCPSVAQRVAIKSCQVNLRDVRIERFTPFELELRLTLGVYNPNSIEVILDRFDYVGLVDGLRLADGQSRHGATIPVNQSRDVDVHVRTNLLDAAQVANRLRMGGQHTATLRGTLYIDVPWGEHPFPIEVSRTF